MGNGAPGSCAGNSRPRRALQSGWGIIESLMNTSSFEKIKSEARPPSKEKPMCARDGVLGRSGARAARRAFSHPPVLTVVPCAGPSLIKRRPSLAPLRGRRVSGRHWVLRQRCPGRPCRFQSPAYHFLPRFLLVRCSRQQSEERIRASHLVAGPKEEAPETGATTRSLLRAQETRRTA